jgi:2-dehydro-3-deoxy-D-arabinonate dehydratase
VSARDIEGENPLYLTQSKIYKNSCSIGPVVITKDEFPNPHNLRIELRVLRKGKMAFEGSTNTSKMKRTIDELLSYLRRNNEFYGWTVFMTGTGIVPPDDFSLQEGDVVEIEIERIGVLRNPVSKLPP